jgi:hypothetical protein
MEADKLLELIKSDQLLAWMREAFTSAGIDSLESLKDDNKINAATQILYDKIPKFPYRFILDAFLGKDKMTKVMFKMRDKMIIDRTLDLSKINGEYIRSILSGLKSNT